VGDTSSGTARNRRGPGTCRGERARKAKKNRTEEVKNYNTIENPATRKKLFPGIAGVTKPYIGEE